jgi:NADP-dependent 3-hydroxy acid dehydrogenase YdfG
MKQWKDRVALVTGASSGIGRAVARMLAGEGLRLAVCARRAELLQDLARETDESGARVRAFALDLRDEEATKAMFEAVARDWGGVDVLVNNAGLGRAAPLLSADSAPWREMLELNVLALCVCTREAVRQMRARGDDGHVVHLSSLAAHRVPPQSGVYAATKFAVRALTEALRQELHAAGSRIRVTAISPGYVETEFAEVYHGSAEAARHTYGRFKVLESSDVAEAVRYVLSQPAHVQVHDVLLRPTAQPN